MPSWQPMPAGMVLHGRYEIEGVSGRGGFGATYRARDRERFGQLCALKELLPTQAENPKVRELFEREARTLLSLRHAGIPAFHAFFFHEGRCYLVEDFIAGRTLAQELEAKGRFSEAEVVAVVDEVLAILEYLHGRVPAVIHRDIKPANIIQAAAGGLYLVDFGAVKEAMVVAALSAESTIIGTSGYTPPEQLRGLVVPASDLYAVGATALHLLTGRSPAELYNVSEGAWRFTGQLGVSPRVEAIIAGLVEEQLARRFQTAAVVREMLRGGPVEASPTRAMSSSGLGERPRDVESAPRATTASPKSLRPGAPAGWRVAPLVGALVVAVAVVGVGVALRTVVSGPDRRVPAATSPAPIAASPAPIAASVPPAVTPPPLVAAEILQPLPAPAVPPPAARTRRELERVARPEPRAAEPTAEARRPSPPVESATRKLEAPPVAESPRQAQPPPAETAKPEPAPNAPPAPAPPPPSPAPPARTAASAVPAPAEPAPALPHRTYDAPADRVWLAAESVLRGLGWDVDKRDPGGRVLVTESRRLDGENFGVYAKDLRHRLRVQVKSVDESKTLVTVERILFRRERIFWVNSDDPVTLPDSTRNQQAEQDVLTAIGRAL